MTSHEDWLQNLYNAMANNQIDSVRQLLQGRHQFDHMEDKDVFGCRLHQAVNFGNPNVVRAILQSGCYVDTKTVGY